MVASFKSFDRILFGKRQPSDPNGTALPPAVVEAKASALASFYDWRVVMLAMGVALTFTWAALWVWLGLRLVTAIV